MKDVTFRVEFTQYVLANSMGPSGQRDCFQRDGSDNLVFQQAWWFSAFRRALEMEPALRHIKAGDICMDLQVSAKTVFYERRYGINQSRVHEAIAPGTIVSFAAMVEDRVTESALRRLLDRIGRFIGISPYGHKLGYGHFKVLELVMAPSEAAVVP